MNREDTCVSFSVDVYAPSPAVRARCADNCYQSGGRPVLNLKCGLEIYSCPPLRPCSELLTISSATNTNSLHLTSTDQIVSPSNAFHDADM